MLLIEFAVWTTDGDGRKTVRVSSQQLRGQGEANILFDPHDVIVDLDTGVLLAGLYVKPLLLTHPKLGEKE